MNDISHIDASFHTQRPPIERSPARDFAHELAKGDNGATATNIRAADGSRQQREPGSPAASIRAANGSHQQREPGSLAANVKAANSLGQQREPGGLAPSVGLSPTEMPRAGLVIPLKSMDAGAGVVAQSPQSVSVQPIGITEALLGSRVFGVHLLAGTYLSELATAGDAGALADVTLPIMTNTGMSEPPPVEVSAAAPVANEVCLDRELPEQAMALISGMIEGDAHEAAICSTSASVPPASLGEAVAMFWPESSFRLTKQGDDSSVVWLRDYRTPDEHVSRLVDELVKAAKAANMRLGRIVLNGREVWISRQNY